MILNNYYNYAGNINNYTMKLYEGSNLNANMGVIDINNQSFNPQYQGNNYTYDQYMTNQARPLVELGVLLGTSTTPATANDYCLGNDITDDIESLDYDAVISGENGQIVLRITGRGVNASSSAVSISEIGIYKDIYTDWSQDEKHRCLFIRHILDTPISVEDGRSFTFAFEWVMT